MLKGAPKHDAHAHTSKIGFYSFRRERGRHFARGHAINVCGHGVGHLDDIDDPSAFDGAAALSVGLLRSNRFILVESKGVMCQKPAQFVGNGRLLNLFFGSGRLAHWSLRYGPFKLGGVGYVHVCACIYRYMHVYECI